MQDGIIKGTGNSRFLKSVPDFLSQYPTYESFVEALAAGTLPVDFNGINETGWQQLGTALNKGNLLSDETAGLYPGLPENPAPDDVLEVLSKAVLYKDANLVTPGGAAVPRVKMVYGTYTGNGGASVTLNASFKPKCVIVLGDKYNLWAIGGDFNSVHSVLLWIEGITTSYFTQRTSTSYTQTATSLIINPASVNENGKKYSYVILG